MGNIPKKKQKERMKAMKKITLLLTLLVAMLMLAACGECEHAEWSNWTTTKGASCTAEGERSRSCIECGEKEYEAIPMTSHSWNAATCTSPKKCRNCWATTGTALGHNVDNIEYCDRCDTFISSSNWLNKKYCVRYILNGSVVNKSASNVTFKLNENHTYSMAVGDEIYKGKWERDPGAISLTVYDEKGAKFGMLVLAEDDEELIYINMQATLSFLFK